MNVSRVLGTGFSNEMEVQNRAEVDVQICPKGNPNPPKLETTSTKMTSGKGLGGSKIKVAPQRRPQGVQRVLEGPWLRFS